MGTTLQNGVYLPNEGERNCYAGLKTNWEILDQKVADITALQQAVAGALHREIVASLPTTDIDPNTIYMILSGTSATENVYDEFMYVNNAWELIGTSATDLTNYYTKGDVDGLLLLKANASDLTSHTGDTTIHVTASDKSKWDTVALIKQLRLVNTQVGSSTTIAFANIDDTNGIKVGDKCMDLDAKMFEITAVDTTNQTVTVGSALIDLAQDSDVVHKSGNETVGGSKTFTNDVTVNNSNATVQADVPNLIFQNPLMERASTTLEGEQTILFTDKNDNNIASIQAKTYTSGISDIILTSYSETSEQNVRTTGIVIRRTPTTSKFHGYSDNITTLGDTNRRWKSVYAMNYYYGNDNVEFSTKFVTTDTAQTISESKTFTNTIKIKKEIELSGSRLAYILPEFSASYSGLSLCTYGSSGAVKLGTWKVDDNDNTKHVLDTSLGYLSVSIGSVNSVNIVHLIPKSTTNSKLGDSVNKWHEINGLTPSSLSMPDFANRVDIAGYISNLSGSTNTYTPTVNGWLYVGSNDASYLALFDTGSSGCGIRFSDGVVGEKYACIPCQANRTLGVRITCTNLAHAYFVPCQGNI